MALTIGPVGYAYVTVKEIRKDRKKETIERRLERVYCPIFDILDRARHDNAERAEERKQPVPRGSSRTWLSIVLSSHVRNIIGYRWEASGTRNLVSKRIQG
jgi:hypothetical protein